MAYPTTAGAKERGGTSEEAADGIGAHGRAATLRRRVRDLLAVYTTGLTADECAARLGEDILSIRPRLSELYRLGDVEKTDVRRASSRGKSAAVYRVNPPTPQMELTL